jgi:hypothetical protein
MIINASSDAILRTSLFAIDNDSKPVSGVVEFNTITVQAEKSDEVPFTIRSFYFYAASEDEYETLVGLLQAEGLESHVVLNWEGPPLSAFAAESSSVLFLTDGHLTALLTTCSDCGHKAIIYQDSTGTVWKVDRTNPADVNPTATSLDKNNLTCVNCGKTGFFHRF